MSYLGYLWALLTPLSNVFIFYMVIGRFFGAAKEDPFFVVYLTLGLFPWQWIMSFTSYACNVFPAGAPLIKKTYFPRYALILASNFQFAFNFIMTLPVVFIVIFLSGFPLNWNLLWGLPLMLILQFLLTFCVGLFLATINVFVRDLVGVVAIAMQLLTYATPIIYKVEQIPTEYQFIILYINPFARFILSWKSLFYEGYIPWDSLLYMVSVIIVGLMISSFVYSKTVRKFADIL